MAQKIIKVGNSAAVTLPKYVMEKLGLKIGSQVDLDIDTDSRRVTITSEGVSRSGVDKELIEWTDNFIEEYRPALDELSRR